MSPAMLRGHRPWSNARAVESDEGRVPIVPRRVDYRCPHNHTLTVPFADLADSEVPAAWECRAHSAVADRVEGGGDAAKDKDATENTKGHQPKTAWDQLIERRTIPELEALLERRLQMLRAGRRGTTRATAARSMAAER